MSHIAQTNIQLYEQLRLSGYDDAAVVAAARAYALAQPLFSARFRGSGRPFLCHLVGTASVLARDGASIEEVTAGLLHAAYDAGLFGYDMHRTVSPRKRAAVREAVGEAGEALVAAYTALPWTGSTLERLAASAARSPEERSVLRLRLANELDDLADGGLRYTGREKASLVDDASHRAKLVTLAQQVDMPHLAADLEAALASHGDRASQPAVAPGIRGPAYSYTRLPDAARLRLSYRLAFFRRRLARRIGRAMPGKAGTDKQ